MPCLQFVEEGLTEEFEEVGLFAVDGGPQEAVEGEDPLPSLVGSGHVPHQNEEGEIYRVEQLEEALDEERRLIAREHLGGLLELDLQQRLKRRVLLVAGYSEPVQVSADSGVARSEFVQSGRGDGLHRLLFELRDQLARLACGLLDPAQPALDGHVEDARCPCRLLGVGRIRCRP